MPIDRRRFLGGLAGTGLAGAVAGCNGFGLLDGEGNPGWTTVGGDAGYTGTNFASAGPATTPTSAWTGSPSDRAMTAPHLRVADGVGVLTAGVESDAGQETVALGLDAASGEEQWRRTIEHAGDHATRVRFQSPVVVDGVLVLVQAVDEAGGAVRPVGIDIESGHRRWTAEPLPAFARPHPADGSVVVAVSEGTDLVTLTRLDAATGEYARQRRLEREAVRWLSVLDRTVVALTVQADGVWLESLPLSGGEPTWARRVGDAPAEARFLRVTGDTASVIRATVDAETEARQQVLYAFDRRDGTRRWRRPEDPVGMVAIRSGPVTPDTVYVAYRDGETPPVAQARRAETGAVTTTVDGDSRGPMPRALDATNCYGVAAGDVTSIHALTIDGLDRQWVHELAGDDTFPQVVPAMDRVFVASVQDEDGLQVTALA